MKYERNRKEGKAIPEIRKLKTKPLVIVAGILLMGNLLWFTFWVISDKSWKTGEEVASVDGKSINRVTWMAAMEEQIGQETLLTLVNDEVMEAAAKKYGINVTKKEIDFELALMRTIDHQSSTGMNAERERKKIRSAIILEKVLTKDVVISDKAINSNYDENASMYNVATAYHTAVIALPTKAEAEQTLSELSGGSSFDVLAKERSVDSASANLGGDIGYINDSRENVDKAIIKAASTMKKETTSDIIALDNSGYAIIYVSDIIEGQKFKLKEVNEHIKRELALEQLPESVNIEAFWKEFDTKWFYGSK